MKNSVFNIGIIVLSILLIAFLALWTVDNYHQYEKPSENNNTPFRLVFVGDVMLSRGTGDIISRKGPEFPFEHVRDTLRRGDIIMGNLESPISNLNPAVCNKSDKTLCFKASSESLRGLTYAGFDIMTVANNHALDYGPEVLNDTINRLSEAWYLLYRSATK